MIDRLLSLCLHRRVLMMVIALATLAYGSYAWIQLPVEAYPELSDVTVQVTTQLPGLAAEEIEQQVTTPLERALAGTPGLVSMRSSSTFGLSLITLGFGEGAEDYWERQRVTERLAQVNLPSGAQPTLDPLSGPTGEIYRYTLESDRRNLMQLSELQRWTVIPALEQIPGVANVDNFGGFTKEFQLLLDPSRLQRYGLSIDQVVSAVNANNANAGGGRVTRGEQSYVIRSEGMVRSLDDMGQIVVSQHGGAPVLLRDLGTLRDGHQLREGILGKDNNPDTIEGIVDLLKGENPSKVLLAVHAKVDQLNAQLAAQGVRIVPYIDRDDLVKATVDKVGHTVVEGVLLVCLVLIAFLGSPRAALVAAVTIPLALVAVFIGMYLTHRSANLFSLGAIDFGVIVDGAIVVTEAILRLREEHPTLLLQEGDVLGATRQVAGPILFATLIIITAYAPLLAFQHAEGKLFSPIAYTVGFALLGALLCALTLVPGLAYLALRKPRKPFHNRPLERLQRGYRLHLGRLLQRPAVAVVAAALAMLAVVGLGATTGREFLPDLDEGALWVQVQMPSGLSLEKASALISEYRKVVDSFPQVSYVITQLGRSDDGTDPWSPSHAESAVGLKPYDQWPAGTDKAQLVAQMSARLEQIPGISVEISQPIADNLNDVVGGAHSPLVLRIYGDDLKEMRRIGNEIVQVLRHTPGTAAAAIFEEAPIPQLVVDVDRQAAARYGINVSDINTLVQTGVGGGAISQAYVGDRIYNITLQLPRALVNDPDQLGRLTLTSASGAQIPLSEVAHLRVQNGLANISHEMGRRELTVALDNQGVALSDYLTDVQQRIAQQVHFDHARYQLEWAGQFQNQRRAQARLSVTMLLVFGVMAVLLFAQFRKLRQVALILGVVPLAMLGGLITLHLRGYTLNIATAVGFIALFGVAVQNGIIMVANINRVREAGGADLHQAVLLGASERFRPVLMTATVASMGMLPAALATGIGTDVQRNLATVVVGGLVVATFLTLFVLPAFYVLIEQRFARRRAIVPPAGESVP